MLLLLYPVTRVIGDNNVPVTEEREGGGGGRVNLQTNHHNSSYVWGSRDAHIANAQTCLESERRNKKGGHNAMY